MFTPSIIIKQNLPNTVKGPSPLKVSTNPAAVTAATKVLKSSLPAAISTIFLGGQQVFSANATTVHCGSSAVNPAAKVLACSHVSPPGTGNTAAGSSNPPGQKEHMSAGGMDIDISSSGADSGVGGMSTASMTWMTPLHA